MRWKKLGAAVCWEKKLSASLLLNYHKKKQNCWKPTVLNKFLVIFFWLLFAIVSSFLEFYKKNLHKYLHWASTFLWPFRVSTNWCHTKTSCSALKFFLGKQWSVFSFKASSTEQITIFSGWPLSRTPYTRWKAARLASKGTSQHQITNEWKWIFPVLQDPTPRTAVSWETAPSVLSVVYINVKQWWMLTLGQTTNFH